MATALLILFVILGGTGIAVSMYGLYQVFTQIIESCVFIYLTKEEIRKGKAKIPQPDLKQWFAITGVGVILAYFAHYLILFAK